ncbi:MAG: hypothetical protein ACKVOR_10045 [Flavobacteriales bacterium]
MMSLFTQTCSILLIFIFSSCKKEETDFQLQGRVTDGRSGQLIPGAQAEVMKQIVGGGTFGATYSTAVSGLSDASGCFSLSWPRENFAALKLKISKNQYITNEDELVVSDFDGGQLLTHDMTIFPEAFVQVQIANIGESAVDDEFIFTFTNAQFDCVCCANGYKTFEGAAVDTTWQCKLYGDSWLKYQKQVYTAAGDTIVNDSVWCPAFNTTALTLYY